MAMLDEAGKKCTGQFQVADGINKPLAAVSDCCDKGNVVIFDNDISCLLRRDSEEGKAIRELIQKAKMKTQIRRQNGVYVMRMRIAVSEQGFPRPGR